MRRSPLTRRAHGSCLPAWTAMALFLAAILSTACTGGSPGPGVAHLGSTAEVLSSAKAGALAFAACMRSHGLPDFPDPGSTFPADIDENSLAYGAAARACRSLLAQRTGPGPSAADAKAFLEFAACIRAHGFPDFPDPTIIQGGKGGISQRVPPYWGTPRFVAAQNSCARWLPKGAPGSHGVQKGGKG